MKTILLLIGLTIFVNADQCKLIEQQGYDNGPKIMTFNIKSDYAITKTKNYIISYKKTRVKNVFLNNDALLAFDILQIDKNLVYMNHFSPNGRAYEIWKCKKVY